MPCPYPCPGCESQHQEQAVTLRPRRRRAAERRAWRRQVVEELNDWDDIEDQEHEHQAGGVS
ncbi:hypothetical protein GCM10020221_11390 [Streptomyces thioluteus]|uniref:Uncharacterized protein n=1 Tax=Streptomyces thioluteus TaxID=66431 RepID=A0ABN3WI72_STRTU